MFRFYGRFYLPVKQLLETQRPSLSTGGSSRRRWGGYCLTLLHAALPLFRPSFVDGVRIIYGVLPVNENVQPVLLRSVVNTIL